MNQQQKKYIFIGMALTMILCAGLLNRWVRSSRASSASTFTDLRRPLSEIPFNIGTFTSRDVPLRPDIMEASRVDAYVQREYMDGQGKRLLVYVGYWGLENVGMGHGPERCYPAAGWQVDSPPKSADIEFSSKDRGVPTGIGLHRFLRTEPEGVKRCAVGFVAVVSGVYQESSRGVFWHRSGQSNEQGGHFLAHVHISTFPESDKWDEAESDIIEFSKQLLPNVALCLPGGIE